MGEHEEISLDQLEAKPCFLGHESKCRVHTSEHTCGCGSLALHWPGQMWLGTNASVSLTPLWESPPGLPQCIVLVLPHITGKSSREISTSNKTWKKLFLVFIWQVPLCPGARLPAGALPCKASCHVEQISILAFGITLYLWGRVPPRLSCSPCSRWESSGRLRTPAQALLQDMCLWLHILALPLSSALMTSQALIKKEK